jgi:hypothetical protein
MESTKTAVFGIYDGPATAERAVEMLVTEGFSTNAVSVLLPDTRGTNDFTHGTLQLLAGIGGLAIPGVGSFIAAGPVVTPLAGLGVGGPDALSSALVAMGLPDCEAKRCEEHLKRGWVLLSVRCDTGHEIIRANGILEATGAIHIASTNDTIVGSSAVQVTAA